jgi:CBS domain-containing protein
MRRVDYIVGARDFKTLKAEQYMEDDVYAYRPEDDGETLAQAMTEGGFGSVPIVDQNRHLLGIVSEYDLLRALNEEKSLASVKAGDLMTPNPVTVSPETPTMDIIQSLDAKHLIRMPVVDEEGKLVGVVARRDVLQGYLNAIRVTRIFN